MPSLIYYLGFCSEPCVCICSPGDTQSAVLLFLNTYKIIAKSCNRWCLYHYVRAVCFIWCRFRSFLVINNFVFYLECLLFTWAQYSLNAIARVRKPKQWNAMQGEFYLLMSIVLALCVKYLALYVYYLFVIRMEHLVLFIAYSWHWNYMVPFVDLLNVSKVYYFIYIKTFNQCCY